MRRWSLVLGLLLGCASPPAEDSFSFWAGTSAIDLTPTRNLPLGGYGGRQGAPMTGVHDPIFAKALWLETPTAKVCLVTTDLIGSLVSLRDQIQPEDASVVLCASHSHSGPGGLVRGFWELAMGKYDPAFYEEIAGKLHQAVLQARANRRPARLAFVRGEAPGFSRNRRVKGGPVDPELNVLRVDDALGRPMAILTNYTAHGTILSERNLLLSGDWQGALQRDLERQFPTAVALYTNGAEGNIAPSSPSDRDGEFERCEALGQAIADKVANLVQTIDKTTERVKLSYVERGVDLPSPTLPAAPKTSVLGLLEINGTRMFCFPGEPFVELGLELKKRFPGAWILGLANDHLGYFLTEEGYARGGYERMVSFYGPTMGPWLVAQLTELGEGKHAQDRPGQSERGRGQDHDRRQP
ncbi:MAG TPA: neutral/alkaline non-lysosomal ceramidase N-terminal domain-containing protein [Planctomycetota bacterium]|nr:neutral/alkaline non-lysosomal ceramidase N-terminal domain-containing protein [Planctomycetota bacterium]